jgi:hypothetical protein
MITKEIKEDFFEQNGQYIFTKRIGRKRKIIHELDVAQLIRREIEADTL